MVLEAQQIERVESENRASLVEARERLAVRLDELISRLQEALEATAFSNRFLLPPRRLPQIAKAEADAFLDFLKAGDADRIREQGVKRAEEGLGEQAMLRLGTTLRQFCRDDLADEALRAGDVYTGALLEGFMEGREAIVLREQEQIRGALQRVINRYALQLTTAGEVSRAASSILDPAKLLPEVVNLVRDRFDFYYVGLFLLDEGGEYAVLRAGTGEAGCQMLEMGHKLEVGGTSMVGWCVAQGKARIALDVGKEAVRFDNPLLPETRSEMALPLISRGRVIGAMTIQSTRSAAFSDEDIAALQTMADQMANAIENARLFEQTQAALAETDALYTGSDRVVRATTLDDVLQALIHSTGLQRLDRVSIAFFNRPWEDEMPEEATIVATWERNGEESRAPVGTRYPLAQFPAIEAVTRDEPAIFRDVTTDERVYETLRALLLDRLGMRSLVLWPLVAGGQWIGFLTGQAATVLEIGEDEIRRIASLTDQAATVIQSIRLFQETQASLKEITLLHQRYLRQEWQEYLADEEARARAGYLYDHGAVRPAGDVWMPEIALAAQRGETVALSEMAAVLQESVDAVGASLRQPFDGAQDKAQDAALQAAPAQSALAVPLKVRGQVIGALDFYETDQMRDWSAEDIAMVEAVANQVALAIENARAYEELQKTAEQLKEMDRLKTQFLANMSHELRTPLNTIIGFSRVILKGIDGPITEQQRVDLTSIYNNGHHLLGLINDILDISRIEAGKMELIFEPVNLRHIIDGVMSTAVALVKDKPIELNQDVDPDLPTIRADGTRVRQVILNLLSNAAKFTERGQITLRAHADQENITISVSDTGIGISADHQTILFQEFSQVDASRTRRTRGAGLGLAISRHLVEMHDGCIWVESEPGVGSTFAFTLPIAGPEAERTEEPEALAELTISPDRKLILVVEDDEGAITLYKRYLEKHGYQIVDLNTGEQAVRWARELSPYVIILDLLLPDKDGWEVLEELKSSRETRQIPLIICTLVSDGEARGLSLGADDYLVKPILEEDLLQALEHLEERQQV